MSFERLHAIHVISLLLSLSACYPGLAAQARADDGPAPGLDDATTKIYQALAESTTLDFIETPLADMSAYLSDLHRIPIRLDADALTAEGLNQNLPVTIDLRGISLDAALTLTLKPLGLAHVVRDGELLITTWQGRFRPGDTAIVDVAVAYLRLPEQVVARLVQGQGKLHVTSEEAQLEAGDYLISKEGAGEIRRQGRAIGVLAKGATVTVQQVRDGHVVCRAQIKGEQKEGWVNDRALTWSSPGDSSEPLLRMRRSAEMSILLRLLEPTSLSMKEVPLYYVLKYLSELHRVKMHGDEVFSWENRSTEDRPVSGTFRDVPLWKALRDILQPHGLAYNVRHGVLLVTKAGEEFEPDDAAISVAVDVPLTWQDEVIARLPKGTRCRVIEAAADELLVYATTTGENGLGWVSRRAVAPWMPTAPKGSTVRDHFDPDDSAMVLDLMQNNVVVGLDERGKVRSAAVWHNAALARLRGLEALRRINCGQEAVTDAGILHVARFPELTELDASDARITDAGVVHLANLRKLQSLDLSGTKIADAALTWVGQNKQLVELDLHDTAITDAGLTHLHHLDDLRQLTLPADHVTKEGADDLRDRLPNCSIDRKKGVFARDKGPQNDPSDDPFATPEEDPFSEPSDDPVPATGGDAKTGQCGTGGCHFCN